MVEPQTGKGSEKNLQKINLKSTNGTNLTRPILVDHNFKYQQIQLEMLSSLHNKNTINFSTIVTVCFEGEAAFKREDDSVVISLYFVDNRCRRQFFK